MSQAPASSEYSAVREGGAGLLDLSSRGRILVSGSEAAMFLNGLITNDIKTLAMNSWMPAAFANVQGRLLAVIRVIHRADGFLIDTDATTRETVLKLLERFTLAGDFHVTDLTGETALFSIQGKAAATIAVAILGNEAGSVERQTVATLSPGEGNGATIIRATHTAEDGFDICVSLENREQVLRTLKNAGAQMIDTEIAETLRIEAGIPRFGIDIDETTIVTEANLDDAVSFTKGCYLGQEIIIRIKHRGHVAKKLAGVVLENKGVVENGARIISDEKGIGRVTSSTFSPQLDRTIALSIVKYDYLTPGTKVKVVSDTKAFEAQVADLPFVRGSWYEN